VDCGLDFGGVSVEEVGLVRPLLHGVKGGRLELLWTGDNYKILDVAIFADDGVENDGAAYMGCSGVIWIDRCHLREDVAGHNAAFNTHGIGGWLGSFSRDARREYCGDRRNCDLCDFWCSRGLRGPRCGRCNGSWSGGWCGWSGRSCGSFERGYRRRCRSGGWVDLNVKGQRRCTGAETKYEADCNRSEALEAAKFEGGLREIHDSPFKVVGIEDSDGVRGWALSAMSKLRRQAHERACVLLFAGNGFGCKRVAEQLAAFCDAGAREPECGVPGDRKRKDFVDEIFCEVPAIHVSELVRDGGVEIFGAQGFKPAGGEQQKALADADRNRTWNV